MSNLWERFENIVTKDEVEQVKKQSEPLAVGEYEMILEKIAPAESQSHLPMLKGEFVLVDGGRKVYYNQMLQNLSNPKMTAVNVSEAVKFVEGLTGTEIEFDTLSGLAQIVENIQTGGVYRVSVSYGKNDFDMKYPKLKIVGNSAEEMDNPFNDSDSSSGVDFSKIRL